MTKSNDDTSLWVVVKETLQQWSADNASRLAAALAYYTIFSMAPLLIILVAIVGFFFGRQAAAGQIVDQIARFTNDVTTASFIQSMIRNAAQPESSLVATGVGLIGMLFGATGVFNELKNSLNTIWNVEDQNNGLRGIVMNRLIAIAMVPLSGILLLFSLIANTILTAAMGWLDGLSPGVAIFSQVANFLFFLFVTGLIFGLIYRYLPDIEIKWDDVWIGALATALLFSIGRVLISLYLSYSSVQSAYGAAGSLMVTLLWIYYSAQIFFLGAEFTQVYANTYGSYAIKSNPPQRDDSTVESTAEPAQGNAQKASSVARATTSPKRAQRVRQHASNLMAAVVIIGAVSALTFIPRRRVKRESN